MDNEMIKIGQITNTQGHKGEVRVYPLTDDKTRFELLDKVTCQIENKLVTLTITNVRYMKTFVILSFAEISDMNKAIELKGSYLLIHKNEILPLEEDRYYIFQLVGLDVWTVDDNYLGSIIDVQETGSNDVYHIKAPDNDKLILIPALKSVIKEINLDTKKVIIDPLPGLLD